MNEKVGKELKGRFTKEPVLAILDLDKKNKNKSICIRLYKTNKVLSIECKDGRWKPVAFLSKSLNKTEKL